MVDQRNRARKLPWHTAVQQSSHGGTCLLCNLRKRPKKQADKKLKLKPNPYGKYPVNGSQLALPPLGDPSSKQHLSYIGLWANPSGRLEPFPNSEDGYSQESFRPLEAMANKPPITGAHFGDVIRPTFGFFGSESDRVQQHRSTNQDGQER